MGNSIIEAREAFYENYPIGGAVNPVIHVPSNPEASKRLTDDLRMRIWDIKLHYEEFTIICAVRPP